MKVIDKKKETRVFEDICWQLEWDSGMLTLTNYLKISTMDSDLESKIINEEMV